MSSTDRINVLTALAAACAVLLAAGCRKAPDTQEQGDKTMSFTVTSSAFADGQPIPKKYTDDGEDVSPPLSWSGAPEATKQFAVIVDDPDAPGDQPWVHWVLYGIPGRTRSLPEATGAKGKPASGFVEGRNSWGRTGWGGPAPPSGTHRYYFKLHALDAELKLQPGLTKDALLKAIQGHVLGTGQLLGTYRR